MTNARVQGIQYASRVTKPTKDVRVLIFTLLANARVAARSLRKQLVCSATFRGDTSLITAIL